MSNAPEEKPERTSFSAPRCPHFLNIISGYYTTPHDGLSFLDLPGEIRNRIYSLVLEIDEPCVPITPRSSSSPYFNGRGNLLSLCRQVGFEAGHLLMLKGTAYVPIFSPHKLYPATIRQLNHRNPYAVRHFNTIIGALINMRMVHMHLHTGVVDMAQGRMLLRNLLSAVKFWGDSSPSLVYSQRRKATVHLDHYFADGWEKDMPQSRSIWNIVGSMDRDKFTDWTVAYYIHTGYDSKKDLNGDWLDARVAECEDLYKKCSRYGVHLRPEIYGLGEWKELEWPAKFLELVKTDITKPSPWWPQYPDDLHGESRRELRRAYRRK